MVINRKMLLIILSVSGGLLAAFVHAVSIGPNAGLKTLTLPGVIPIATAVGTLAGFLLSPIMVWAMKDKNLSIGVPAIYGLVCLITVLLNIFQIRYSMYISFGITAVMLYFYRFIGR